jgi:hypothetical protein
MDLFLDKGTTRKFAVLLRKIPPSVDRISAAIAFTRDGTLLDVCEKQNIALEWWGLFTADEATSFGLIKRALSASNVRFYPFTELFHPKVIWFHGYGIYLGSHNMTYSALMNNVEVGVFLPEEDLSESQIGEIAEFFAYLRQRSVLATNDDLERIETFLSETQLDQEKADEYTQGKQELFEERFGHLFNIKAGVTDFEKADGDAMKKRRLAFLKEWRETQKYLSIVREQVTETCTQPPWVSPHADPTIITDQLLHAYYYGHVLPEYREYKSIEAVNEEYRKNRGQQSTALQRAISWWEQLESAPNNEDIHINEWGPTVRHILAKLPGRDLSVDELTEIFLRNHAVRNHARQVENSVYGLESGFIADENERVRIYTRWLHGKESAAGLRINEVLRFLLFEDRIDIEDRVFDTVYDPKYRLEHFGRSIVGEIVGWGRPDVTHLRNNRVNKALRCLGYDVRLFSE